MAICVEPDDWQETTRLYGLFGSRISLFQIERLLAGKGKEVFDHRSAHG